MESQKRGQKLKDYYYKFLIKSNKRVSEIEINAIKKAIMKILIDIPIINIHGGMANNNGYEKFKVQN